MTLIHKVLGSVCSRDRKSGIAVSKSLLRAIGTAILNALASSLKTAAYLQLSILVLSWSEVKIARCQVAPGSFSVLSLPVCANLRALVTLHAAQGTVETVLLSQLPS